MLLMGIYVVTGDRCGQGAVAVSQPGGAHAVMQPSLSHQQQ